MPRSTGVDPDTFRSLLGTFATGVTVVTVRDDQGRDRAMTASSVAAVSLTPPLVLVCVGHDAAFHSAIAGGSYFALNVLAEEQVALSPHFASEHADPFRGVASHRAEHGMRLLDGAAAHIVCAPWSDFEAGDHTIFVGTVVAGLASDRQPLIHHRGSYAVLREASEPPTAEA